MPVPEVTPDPPSHLWRAMLALIRRLPQASLSRGMGRVADIPLPGRLRRPVLGAFAKAFGIDVSEAERPLAEYGSINDFFVRRLKAGVRSWPVGPGLASPVDGVIGQVGRVEAGRLLQAKGRSYSAAELLTEAESAERFEGGLFVTLYLAPRHYHRVHAPVGGELSRAHHVPGTLLPVNRPSVAQTENLFVRNERLVCPLDAADGSVAVVAVGAYNVGRISTAFDPAWGESEARPWVTNRADAPPRLRRYDPPIPIERGEEMMAFHLGSTVVLLVEGDALRPTSRCRPGTEVELGELLAVPATDRTDG